MSYAQTLGVEEEGAVCQSIPMDHHALNSTLQADASPGENPANPLPEGSGVMASPHPLLHLNTLIDDFLKRLPSTGESRIVLEWKPAAELWSIRADASQIRELLAGLIQNAQEAMPAGGRLVVETFNVSFPNAQLTGHRPMEWGDFIQLQVSDTGPCVATSARPQRFGPAFTMEEPSQGTGDGLAIAYRIAKEYRGWIECASDIGEGARFAIYLPRSATDVPLPPDPCSTAPAPTILLVDDELMVQRVGAIVLRRHGYQVLLASDGQEALTIYQRERQRIDLVILDLNMPRMSGSEAFRRLVEINPGIRVLFCSSYITERMTGADPQKTAFLPKPFRQEELLGMIRNLLENRPQRIPPVLVSGVGGCE